MSDSTHGLTDQDLRDEAEELHEIADSLERGRGNTSDLVERIRQVARTLRSEDEGTPAGEPDDEG